MDEYAMCWGVKYLHEICDPQKDHVLLHETSKKCRVNIVSAPGEFFLLASIEKRQLIYYLH